MVPGAVAGVAHLAKADQSLLRGYRVRGALRRGVWLAGRSGLLRWAHTGTPVRAAACTALSELMPLS